MGIFFVGMFRIALPLNLQVTLLAIQQTRHTDRDVSHEALLSIILGFASTLPLVVSIVQVELLWCKACPICERSPDGQWTYRHGSFLGNHTLSSIKKQIYIL